MGFHKLHFMLAVGLLLAATAVGQGRIVINELVYSNDGTDDRELIELYNAGNQNVDIAGWTIVNAGPFSTFGTIAIAPTTPGSTTIIPPGGYYVIGAPGVPVVDQLIASDSLNNDQSAFVLYDGPAASGTVIDAIMTEVNKNPLWVPAYLEGDGLFGNFDCISGVNSSWSRWRDGLDTDDNGRDFGILPWTPGASNDAALMQLTTAASIAEIFNGLPLDSTVSFLGAAWNLADVIDPTALGLNNYTVIPDSSGVGGSGGYCMTTFDLPGGNMNMGLIQATDSIELECLAYFDTTSLPAGQYENWSIGVQGTTGSYYNTTDYGNHTGCPGCLSNGNTGISWTYQLSPSGSGWLYLVDHNDGGVDFTVLGSIQIQAGVNDGWRRLRIKAGATRVEANFGGTLGNPNDGQKFSAILNGGIGGFYFAFRENAHPQTPRTIAVDDLQVRVPADGQITEWGTAKPWTGGVPRTSANSFPKIGDSSFDLVFINNNTVLPVVGYFIGFNKLPMPFDLGLIGIPGAHLYHDAVIQGQLPVDASGRATLPFGGVPNAPALVGASMYVQSATGDPMLPSVLKFAVSAVTEIIIGM